MAHRDSIRLQQVLSTALKDREYILAGKDTLEGMNNIDVEHWARQEQHSGPIIGADPSVACTSLPTSAVSGS